MVTYRFRLPELLVRFQPLHLFFFFLLFFLLAPSVNAAEVGYVERPDTFFDQFVSDESLFSLNTTMPTQTFYLPSKYDSVRWYWNQKESMVTSASDFSTTMWNRLDDGDKTVLGAVANVVAGLDKKIVANSVSVPELDKWINNSPAVDISSGLERYRNIPDLLALITQNQNSIYSLKNVVRGAYAFGNYTPFFGVNLPDLIAMNTQNSFQAAENISYLRRDAFNSTALSYLLQYDGEYETKTFGYKTSDMFAALSQNQVFTFTHMKDWFTVPDNTDILYKDGKVHLSNGYDLAQTTAWGFLGLSQNIAGDSKEIILTNTDPNDPLNTDPGFDSFDSIFDFFSIWGSTMQRELTKLRFVLASDDDIEMKEEEKPNEDAVKDNFFGDGEGAVKPGDISSAGDLAGSVKDSFSGAGSATDAFVAINSSDAYSFFSQEVSNSLDTVGSPSVVSNDDFMDNFVADDEGFYTLFDTSYFDMKSFLQGENK